MTPLYAVGSVPGGLNSVGEQHVMLAGFPGQDFILGFDLIAQ